MSLCFSFIVCFSFCPPYFVHVVLCTHRPTHKHTQRHIQTHRFVTCVLLSTQAYVVHTNPLLVHLCDAHITSGEKVRKTIAHAQCAREGGGKKPPSVRMRTDQSRCLARMKDSSPGCYYTISHLSNQWMFVVRRPATSTTICNRQHSICSLTQLTVAGVTLLSPSVRVCCKISLGLSCLFSMPCGSITLC